MAQRRREWRGCVFQPDGKPNLWIKVRVGPRDWRNKPTPFLPHQREQADALLAEVREEILAREAAMGGEAAPVTVRAWGRKWLSTREDYNGDDARILRLHVNPVIGDMLLAEVGSRHILELAQTWKGAPRTLRNRYSTTHSMFADAAVAGLIQVSPCILRRGKHLPTIEDADAEWRASAVFKRSELVTLITPTAAVEEDSTIVYSLLGLAGVRHGEMAGLRWRHYDPDREPLGSLLIATSYGRGRTKTKRTRIMPVHPLLASVLAQWKLTGWSRLMGRAPTDDDLVVPQPLQNPAGRRFGKRAHLQVGDDSRMRTKDHSWKRFARHLEDLKLRHRRIHDLRRTFISLARADGADRDVLRWGTHGRSGDIMDAYTEMDWKRLCGEVAKLKVARAGARRVVPMRR
jgi:integrase